MIPPGTPNAFRIPLFHEEAVVVDFGGNFVGEEFIGGFEGVEEGGVGGVGAVGIHDASGVSALE